MRATTAELLLARADDDATGLLYDDRRWSWREVVAEAADRAVWLQSVRPDETEDRPWHVGVLADNTPDYLFLIAGAALCGATIVGINHTRRGAELAADIRATHCDTVVVEETMPDLLDGLDHGARRVVPMAQATDLSGTAGPPHATPEALDPTTRFLLLFTSGSTGAPKAVICSTGRFATICQLTPLQLSADDVAYNAMPMFHGNALMASWGPCLAPGAAWALRHRFSASQFRTDVQRFGATYFNYVGRSLSYVLARPEDPAERDNRLRFGFGTEASTRDRAEFERRFGCPVIESYGSSEGVCSIRLTPETPLGALGLPAPGTPVEVLAPDGTVCAPARFDAAGVLLNADEAVGEIVAVGAAARFEGYYDNPDATADKVRGDDVWTGDLAYRGADGWFWFAGRTADWLRVDSENFAAAPVERILARFPGVALAAVYPVPDPRTGDRVMTCLQLDEATTFDPDAFAMFVAGQPDLGPKWVPSLVRITRDLPVTATRKVDKPRLRRDRWAGPDPVWERAAAGYRLVTDERRADLRGEFAAYGRETLLSL